MNNTEILNINLSSNTENRKSAIETAMRAIVNEELSLHIDTNELYLSIDEAITNAMEHGNRWDGNKKINILIFHNDKELVIQITDEGDGFDYKNARNRFQGSDKLSKRGRGIFIMNQFCKIKWNSSGNSISLIVKKLK